jgi:polyisoprenoid-binding protein YceI
MNAHSVATAPATALPTAAWSVDASHSHVEFAVRHLMISTVRGRFGAVSGSITTDEANPAASTVDISVDVASIDTREAQRDAHLRSADFFDVEHFPTLTFRSTRVEEKGEGTLRVAGNLTIRDVTRPVVLDVTSEGAGRDPWGGERAGFSATTTIRRSEFGLTWNQLLETGGVAVGDEVRIAIDVELVKQAR